LIFKIYINYFLNAHILSSYFYSALKDENMCNTSFKNKKSKKKRNTRGNRVFILEKKVPLLKFTTI